MILPQHYRVSPIRPALPTRNPVQERGAKCSHADDVKEGWEEKAQEVGWNPSGVIQESRKRGDDPRTEHGTKLRWEGGVI
jgi:hypothetical protein